MAFLLGGAFLISTLPTFVMLHYLLFDCRVNIVSLLRIRVSRGG